jgi:hypothetical protein
VLGVEGCVWRRERGVRRCGMQGAVGGGGEGTALVA